MASFQQCDLCKKTEGGHVTPRGWMMLYDRTKYTTGSPKFNATKVCETCKVTYTIAAIEHIILQREAPAPQS